MPDPDALKIIMSGSTIYYHSHDTALKFLLLIIGYGNGHIWVTGKILTCNNNNNNNDDDDDDDDDAVLTLNYPPPLLDFSRIVKQIKQMKRSFVKYPNW